MAGADAHQVIARQWLRQVDRLDIIEGVGRGRVRGRITPRELVAAVEGAIRGNDLQVQIIDQRGNGAGEARHVRIGQGDLQRLVGALNQRVMEINLAVGQQDGLVHVLEVARGGAEVGDDDVGQGDAAPSFVVVGDRARAAVQLIELAGRVDERRLDQRGRWHRVRMQAFVILDENGRRAGGMGSGHAGATHIHVVVVNRGPGDRRLVRGGG